MSVWLCIPSARPVAEADPVLERWWTRGYRIAVWRDAGTEALKNADVTLWGDYPGYAKAVNRLVHQVMDSDKDAEWFVTGGDDIHPDLNHTAEEIALECSWHFFEPHWREAELQSSHYGGDERRALETFGVMQPTGDRWGDKQGAYADRVCCSPWMGREFCRRIYGGTGPIWPEFDHMFEDEHLQAVAQKLGILWQRPDLIHYHEHWVRKANDAGGFRSMEERDAVEPKHLKAWSGKEHWDKSKAIFERLKAGGFKEAEDLLP